MTRTIGDDSTDEDTPLGVRRVLIVEDSPAMRELLRLAVKRVPDVLIEQAEDGVAALRALVTARNEGRPFHLVLLDLNMPVMDGMAVLERMREDRHLGDTQVAIVSTEESSDTEAEALRLGARFFVRKPVNRRTIEKLLTDVFGVPVPRKPAQS
jgi:two-component system chemotaxis response regulator CheY